MKGVVGRFGGVSRRRDTVRPQIYSLVALLLSFICTLTACGQTRVNVGQDAPPSESSAPAQAHPAADPQSVAIYTYEVVNSFPHDPKAFTQGLAFHDGWLYESTGHNGESSLRKIELRTGKVKKRVDLSSQYFGEGMTILEEKIYQLTWTTHKGFVYDLKSFRLEGEFSFEGEGWGLTNDGQLLIASDGTNQLRFFDPRSFKTVRTISVLDHGAPLMELNELEYVKGEIYANIWKVDRIVRIDPQTGKILGWIDLRGLYPAEERTYPEEDVLNGIAYDEKSDRLFVAGKRWPKLFEIRLKKKQQ